MRETTNNEQSCESNLDFLCGVHNEHVNQIFLRSIHPVVERLQETKHLYLKPSSAQRSSNLSTLFAKHKMLAFRRCTVQDSMLWSLFTFQWDGTTATVRHSVKTPCLPKAESSGYLWAQCCVFVLFFFFCFVFCLIQWNWELTAALLANSRWRWSILSKMRSASWKQENNAFHITLQVEWRSVGFVPLKSEVRFVHCEHSNLLNIFFPLTMMQEFAHHSHPEQFASVQSTFPVDPTDHRFSDTARSQPPRRDSPKHWNVQNQHHEHNTSPWETFSIEKFHHNRKSVRFCTKTVLENRLRLKLNLSCKKIEIPSYFSSWAMAAICSTLSWCAAKSLSNASCFFFKAWNIEKSLVVTWHLGGAKVSLHSVLELSELIHLVSTQSNLPSVHWDDTSWSLALEVSPPCRTTTPREYRTCAWISVPDGPDAPTCWKTKPLSSQASL